MYLRKKKNDEDGKVLLEEGIDYKLAGNVAKDPGTYTMTITAIGKFEGTRKVNYTIVEAKPEKKEDKKEETKEGSSGVASYALIGGALVLIGAIVGFILSKKGRK